MSKNTRTRILLTAVAALLLLTLTVGGTLAWLTAESNEVENVFTTSTVGVELDESDDLDLQMVPGSTITKDPYVTVTTGSEDCWVFVVVEESTDFDTYLSYEMADGWELVNGEDNVYYYTGTYTAGTAIYVIKNNAVVVSTEITTSEMAGLTGDNAPTLTFKAYVCQKENVSDAATAWSYIENKGKTPTT